MRLFFSKHELKLRRKRTIAAIICAVVVLGVYWMLTRPQKAAPEMPTVIVEPVVKDDVEIYLSLIHISEPTRQAEISYAVFCLKKKKMH